MRRLLILLLAIFTATTTLSAQNSVTLKMAKKNAKLCKKEGWRAIDGDPTLEEQYAKYYEYILAYDEPGEPEYYIVTSIGEGKSYNTALKDARYFTNVEICQILYPDGLDVLIDNDNIYTSFFAPEGFKLAEPNVLVCATRTKNDKIEVLIISAYKCSECYVPEDAPRRQYTIENLNF